MGSRASAHFRPGHPCTQSLHHAIKPPAGGNPPPLALQANHPPMWAGRRGATLARLPAACAASAPAELLAALRAASALREAVQAPSTGQWASQQQQQQQRSVTLGLAARRGVHAGGQLDAGAVPPAAPPPREKPRFLLEQLQRQQQGGGGGDGSGGGPPARGVNGEQPTQGRAPQQRPPWAEQQRTSRPPEWRQPATRAQRPHAHRPGSLAPQLDGRPWRGGGAQQRAPGPLSKQAKAQPERQDAAPQEVTIPEEVTVVQLAALLGA